ncbi:hypothetical protein F5X97DRAFT_157356 [Nemania serpens]|nr:hypothetical protein F5X97DRAFT_157356 [Nemania serpens]
MYTVLTFEGPGQRIVVRGNKRPMRPDQNIVTKHVLDHFFAFVKQYPKLSLDTNHMVVLGASIGGYFALRKPADRRLRIHRRALQPRELRKRADAGPAVTRVPGQLD